MNVDFPRTHVSVSPAFLHIRSERPVSTLSSAVVGGGFGSYRDIINRHVDKDYQADDVVRDQIEFAQAHGVTEPFIGLLTAVYIEKARTCTLRQNDLTVAAVVTAGVGNATCAGVTAPALPHPGTINIILLLDANLAPAAMVNAVITASEAKTHMLIQRQVRTIEGDQATGTSTDSIVVACSGRGATLPYAGPATVIGSLIGRSVRQCLQEALP
jgi:adenosylcobinamide hydrolase